MKAKLVGVLAVGSFLVLQLNGVIFAEQGGTQGSGMVNERSTGNEGGMTDSGTSSMGKSAPGATEKTIDKKKDMGKSKNEPSAKKGGAASGESKSGH